MCHGAGGADRGLIFPMCGLVNGAIGVFANGWMVEAVWEAAGFGH